MSAADSDDANKASEIEVSSVFPIPEQLLGPAIESLVQDSHVIENAPVEPDVEATSFPDPFDSLVGKAVFAFPRNANLPSDPTDEIAVGVAAHPADGQIVSNIAITQADVNGVFDVPVIGKESTSFHVIVEGARGMDIEPDSISSQSQVTDGEVSEVQLVTAETSPPEIMTSSNIPDDAPHVEESVSYKVVVEGVSSIVSNVHNLEMDNVSPSGADYGEGTEINPFLDTEALLQVAPGTSREGTEVGVSKLSLEVAKVLNQQSHHVERTITFPTFVKKLSAAEDHAEELPIASPGSGKGDYNEITEQTITFPNFVNRPAQAEDQAEELPIASPGSGNGDYNEVTEQTVTFPNFVNMPAQAEDQAEELPIASPGSGNGDYNEITEQTITFPNFVNRPAQAEDQAEELPIVSLGSGNGDYNEVTEQTVTFPNFVNRPVQAEDQAEELPIASPGSGNGDYNEITDQTITFPNFVNKLPQAEDQAEDLLIASPCPGSEDYDERRDEELLEKLVQGEAENRSSMDQKTDSTHCEECSTENIEELSSAEVLQHESGSLILEGIAVVTPVSAEIMQNANNESSTTVVEFFTEECEAKIVSEDLSGGTNQRIEAIQCEGSPIGKISNKPLVSEQVLMENRNYKQASKELTESVSEGEPTRETQAFETFIEPSTNGIDDTQYEMKEAVPLARELTFTAHEPIITSKLAIEVDKGCSMHPPTEETIIVEEFLHLASDRCTHMQEPVTSHTIEEDNVIISNSSSSAECDFSAQQISADEVISLLYAGSAANNDNRRMIEIDKESNKVENNGANVNNEEIPSATLTDAVKTSSHSTFVDKISYAEFKDVLQDDDACSMQPISTFKELSSQEFSAEYSFSNMGEASSNQLIPSAATDDDSEASYDHTSTFVEVSHRLMHIVNDLVPGSPLDQANRLTEGVSVRDEANKHKKTVYCQSTACVNDDAEEAYKYEDSSLKGSCPETEVQNHVETVVATRTITTPDLSENFPIDGDNQNGQNTLVHQEPTQLKEHPHGSVRCTNGEKQFQSVETDNHMHKNEQNFPKGNGNVRRKERFNIGVKLPLLMTGIALAAVAVASISRSNR